MPASAARQRYRWVVLLAAAGVAQALGHGMAAQLLCAGTLAVLAAVLGDREEARWSG